MTTRCACIFAIVKHAAGSTKTIQGFDRLISVIELQGYIVIMNLHHTKTHHIISIVAQDWSNDNIMTRIWTEYVKIFGARIGHIKNR